MALSLEELEAKLARSAPEPVVLVLGAGSWARQRAVESLRRATVGAEETPWAVSQGRAGECSLTELLDSARTLPLGVARRFVLLRGAEALPVGDLASLADYAAEPSASTCLVVEGQKLASSGAAARRLRAAAVLVDCPAPRPYQVPRWLEGEIRRRGRQAGPGAVERFRQILGDDPEALLAGLEKVLAWIGDASGPVTGEAVSTVLSAAPHGTVWDFVEAMEDRRPAAALSTLRALLDQGEPPEGILRLVARSRRQLLAGVTARRRGATEDGVLEAMGVPPRARSAPRVRRAILGRLGRHHEEALAAAQERLLAADSALKGEGPDPRTVLTGLVLALLGRAPGASGDRRRRS